MGDYAKYHDVRNFLADHHYYIAPVSIDSHDWEYLRRYYHTLWPKRPEVRQQILNTYLARLKHTVLRQERESQQRYGRQINEILLIHMNRINVDALPSIIQLFRSLGYQFISLPEALKDPVYAHEIGEYKVPR